MNCVKSRPDSDSDCDGEERGARDRGPRAPPPASEHELGVGHAEDLEHVLEPHLACRRRSRAARACRGRRGSCRWPTREHAHGGVGHLDLLLGGHPPQHARDLLERGALEVEAVAAVDDRGRAPCAPRSSRARTPRAPAAPPASSGTRSRPPWMSMCASSRMYTRLPPCIGASASSRAARGCRPRSCWRPRPSPPRRARCRPGWPGAPGRIGVEIGARSALGVQGAGEQLRHRRLAGAARPHEQVCMVHLVELDRVPERPDDVLLAHHRVEGPGAVAAVEREHRWIRA